jgi:signal transduction histidine kinase
MRHASTWSPGHAPVSAPIALALGSGAAGLAGAALALWLTRLGFSLTTALAASVGAAILTGLALALPLLARLGELDVALEALARDDAARVPARAWPLEGLLGRVAALSARMAEVAERERQAEVYRAELTRQVSEAAAREERNRLARELHDSIKQQLFSIDVSAAAARARGGVGEGAELTALADIQESARAAQAEMTALLQQLRPAPLENVGLVEALRDQLTALGYRTGADVSLSVGELPPEDRLPPRAQEELFRMAQEALANVARHARARHVWLRLERQGGDMLLEVRDDGQGFDMAKAPAGMGLNNLRERARALGGMAEITSAVGEGTVARIRLPLAEPPRVIAPEELARRIAWEAASARGDWWRQLMDTILRVAFLLLLFGLPIWVVALGIGTAAFAGAMGRAALNEVARLAGVGSAPELGQRQGDRETLGWLFFGLALCAGYLPVYAPSGWSPDVAEWATALTVTALLALGFWNWERWRRASERWHRILPVAQRQESIERRWRETLSMWSVIGVIIIVGLLLGGWAPALPPRTPGQWSDTASVALLVLLITLNSAETWLAWRWRRALASAEESEARA